MSATPVPIQIISAKTEALSTATRDSIIELCIAAHHNDDFRNLFTYVPAGGWHFLARREELLVSHAMVTTRWLQPDGWGTLKTAYVDAVSTAPGTEGRGYASAVMRQLANDVAASYVIACLQTDIPDFYTRLGWELWHGALAGRAEHGLVPTPDEHGIMVLRLPLTPPLSLDQALTIECQPHRIW